jgi:pyruvate dehydrogenase E2 component (dihydrolipoamide acetyltransferase)
VERIPFRSLRKKIAERMSQSWSQIPHVTHFDRADVTELEALRRRHAERAAARGGKLTVTALALRAAAVALKEFPEFNASLEGDEIVLKKYYHLGVAVDTDRGLIVPVIRDVDRKTLFELARELTDLSERTRAGKAELAELQGATFTITNLGGLGGTHFTPLINPPEVAILGLARSREEPVVRNGEVQVRLILPLCVSYDHRVIDGATAARFTRRIVELLEDPERLLLGG